MLAFKRLSKKSICSGDFRHKIELCERTFIPPYYSQTEPFEAFGVLGRPFANIMTIAGTARFNKINIVDGATHIFKIKYTPKYKELEAAGEVFIKFKDKFFRVLKVANDDEDSLILNIQAEERGDINKDASTA